MQVLQRLALTRGHSNQRRQGRPADKKTCGAGGALAEWAGLLQASLTGPLCAVVTAASVPLFPGVTGLEEASGGLSADSIQG